MNIPDLKRVRERTGCGLMEAGKALQEAAGDVELAVTAVRRRSQDRPPQRTRHAGGVFAYLHHNQQLGCMLVLACDTDFVVRTEYFQELGKELAIQVAATNPIHTAALLDQTYIRDESKTIRQLIAEVVDRVGETVTVQGFHRFQV